jgi:hypothetical protein
MIMNGAIKSWQIDRVFRDSLASLLEKCSNK